MSQNHTSDLSNSNLPMPARYMQMYGRFWDVVSLLIFGFTAITTLTAEPLTWREYVVSGLCILQGVLYFFTIAGGRWIKSRQRLAMYFIGGLAMWLLSNWLNPLTWWLAFAYFGQMFGVLPPQAVIPGTAFIMICVTLIISDWQFSAIDSGAAIGFFFQWLAGNVLYLFIFGIARTSRQRAGLIQKLEAAQRELEAARQQDAELATLRERERVARDLHDSLGHSLVALSVQLEAIQRLYKVDPERASAQVDELKNLTRASMDELRRSLAGLRAPGLGERKLGEALQTLCVDVGQRAHLEIRCDADEHVNTLPLAHAETLWRVAQEALTNVERHAQARHVTVTLKVETHTVLMTIQDDGRGLPPNAENQSGHFGLRGMRERVEGLGGTLTLTNNNGSNIQVSLPLF
ncbi:MAG: sensor histidine kinase [Anaerolineales bacterium]|nr:sensor histidine kinase [Anaerolineales bacterium]MBK9781246.1 sensor histidine kinase [Anaerolineales bacterium]